MENYFERNSFWKFASTIVLLYIGLILISGILSTRFGDSALFSLMDILVYVLFYIVLFVVPNSRRDREAILRRPEENSGNALQVILPFFLMSFTSLLYVNLIRFVSPGLYDAFLESPNLSTNMGRIEDPFRFGVAFVAIVILAPIVEELIFRGVLFNMLSKRHSIFFSLLVSGLFFGILHFATFFPAAILGFVLGFIYHKTGNIRLSIAAHMFNNLVSFTMPYVISIDPLNPGSLEIYMGVVIMALDLVAVIYFIRFFARNRSYFQAEAPVFRGRVAEDDYRPY